MSSLPGPIEATEVFHEIIPKDSPRLPAIVQSIPVKRLGLPEDVARAILFFVDPAGGIHHRTNFVCLRRHIGRQYCLLDRPATQRLRTQIVLGGRARANSINAGIISAATGSPRARVHPAEISPAAGGEKHRQQRQVLVRQASEAADSLRSPRRAPARK